MSVGASPDSPFAGRNPGTPYSVPRRYDLATLMAVTLAYALLFGVMRWWQASPAAIGFVSLFVTLVGLGQALLFRGRHPRAASAIVGVLAGWAVALAVILIRSAYGAAFPATDWIVYIISLAIGPVWAGPILGYLVGTLIAGVFLVADLIRQLLRRLSRRNTVRAGTWDDTTEGGSANDVVDEQADRGPVVWATVVGEGDSAEV